MILLVAPLFVLCASLSSHGQVVDFENVKPVEFEAV